MPRRDICPAHAELKDLIVEIRDTLRGKLTETTQTADKALAAANIAAARVERAAWGLGIVAATLTAAAGFVYAHGPQLVAVAGLIRAPSTTSQPRP